MNAILSRLLALFCAAFWGFAFELSIRTFWLHGSPFLIYVLRFFFPITVNCQVQVLNWFSHDSDSSWPFSLSAHQTTSPCFLGMRCLHMKKDSFSVTGWVFHSEFQGIQMEDLVSKIRKVLHLNQLRQAPVHPLLQLAPLHRSSLTAVVAVPCTMTGYP